MPLIGFLAKKRRGKDTACDYFVEKHGFVKNSFAGPLKKGVQRWFGFTDEQMYTEKKEEVDEDWGISPRVALQVIGTDVVRDQFDKLLLPGIGKGFWIKNFDIWYKKNGDNVVVSDVRAQNEVDYIKSKGGIIIKLERDWCDEEEKKDGSVSHASETWIDDIKDFDFVIKNNGTLEEFFEQLEDNYSKDSFRSV